MNNTFSLEQFIKGLKTNDFILNCNMPLGYSAGIPLLKDCNGRLCVVIPYLRYKSTGKVDKTLIYPIRFAVTVEVPEGKIVGFSNLEYAKGYSKVKFDEPCGLFRHEAIQDLTKKQYNEKRKELLGMYDKLIAALMGEGDYTEEDETAMKSLLGTLLEPCLFGAYKALDKNFYNRFLA